MDLFYDSTIIIIGNGGKAPFWDSSWLHGGKPKDIAPLTYDASKRKKWCVGQALKEDAWIAKVVLSPGWSLLHIWEFVNLWSKTREM